MTKDPTTHQIHCNPTLRNMSSRNCHAQDLSAQTATKDSNWHLTFSHWNLSKRYTCNDVSIIRLHCSITFKDVVYCYRVVWSVVCHTSETCKKTAELIEMQLGLRTWVSPGNHVLDGVQSPRGKGKLLGKGAPIVKYVDLLLWAVQKRLNGSICCLGCGLGWAEGSTSSIVFARWRQSALLCGHIGATWRIRLNHRLRWWCGLMSNYLDHLLIFHINCLPAVFCFSMTFSYPM